MSELSRRLAAQHRYLMGSVSYEAIVMAWLWQAEERRSSVVGRRSEGAR